MNPLRTILTKFAAEFRLHRLGRRSLREIQFSKYKVAARETDRIIAERLLRRLPGSFGTSPLNFSSTH